MEVEIPLQTEVCESFLSTRMKHLRNQINYMRENAFAVSVSRYLQRRHAPELKGLEGKEFDDKFRRIRQTYLFEKQN